MQEVIGLILERLKAVSDIKNVVKKPLSKIVTPDEDAILNQQLISYIINLRRDEKERIVKESELLQLVFTSKTDGDLQLW